MKYLFICSMFLLSCAESNKYSNVDTISQIQQDISDKHQDFCQKELAKYKINNWDTVDLVTYCVDVHSDFKKYKFFVDKLGE